MIWIATEQQLDVCMKHAGGKAREDVKNILQNHGVLELPIMRKQKAQSKSNLFMKLYRYITAGSIWKKSIYRLKRNDILIVQFPLINNYIFFSRIIKCAQKRGIKVYAFIHDLDTIRIESTHNISFLRKCRVKFDEKTQLRLFDGFVVHNKKMKNYLQENMEIPSEKMVELEIFDYLIDYSYTADKQVDDFKSCIIAGNLDKVKSSYIYDLPSAPKFELYGINFEGECANNVNYHGSYSANELPFHLQGGFGLVWDGNSSFTCGGATGEYLRYNNPHKTSLYLACGIPVIIWNDAALADFISDNEVGFTISSLEEINTIFSKMNSSEFYKYKANAINLSKKLREGVYTIKAIELITNSKLS